MNIFLKIISASISLFVISNSVSAQESTLIKANDEYENFRYIDAISSYKNIINSGNGTIEVYQKLGNCHYYNANLSEAAKFYEKMWSKKEEIELKKEKLINKSDTATIQKLTTHFDYDIPVEYYFRTAQAYKFVGDYKKADNLMLMLQKKSKTDSRARRFIENPEYLKDIAKQSGRYRIENYAQNSIFTDFAPSFYEKSIVFSSARKDGAFSGQKNEWTKQSYLDLFQSFGDSLSYALGLSKQINTRLHESTSSFSKGGKIVYFTRNNFSKSKIQTDSTGVSRLKIFKATINEKKKWHTIKEVPFNSDQYSVAHPALNRDNTKLYFASDMPGGYGMSDLYVVDIYNDGSFGEPKNLGPDINTEGRETFPFISNNDVLYFASDGHLGLGGLDIFTFNFNEEKEDNKVYNVGEPINSTADDITFIINDETKKGYFASNREGGRGDDDIYSFIETTPLLTKCEGSLEIIVLDINSGDVLQNAGIEIKDKNGEVVQAGRTNERGTFIINVDCDDKEYLVAIEKENYNSDSKKVTITREKPNGVEKISLKNNLPAKGIDLAKTLDLKPIYFASNKALILGETAKELDKIVAYMKEYLPIKIEIGSHTDSRGSDAYNLKLSQKRAISTANYIISKGIDPSRVKSRGYGETVLINKCSNGVKCSKEDHGKNRRSEFIVISNE
ncbi:OmpA family protein [Aquimarina pacifica]|uniref:OmpA family protein n=1 Tax=Aquimarina pacifica TaxID=1296415 RepID=UPI0004713419|nr:OmpA family protein [Aquimarina pacifica]